MIISKNDEKESNGKKNIIEKEIKVWKENMRLMEGVSK